MVAAALALALMSSVPTAPAPGCDAAFRARFPALDALFTSASAFRAQAAAPHASFTRVVEQGNALRKAAAAALDTLQGAGCDLRPEDGQTFDACLSPLQWGCEGVPPGIDWSALAAMPKKGDEAQAYALTVAGVDLLTGTPLFEGGCGDFGCAPQSVSLPGVLGEPKEVEAWVTLASGKGRFSARALAALEQLGKALTQAACTGEESWRPAPAERTALIQQLDAKRAKLARGGRLGRALAAISAGLSKGPPAKTCDRPGEGE